MIKVADTQIKNIGFNTSVETGTRVKSQGEALAGIITTTIGAKKSLDHAQHEQDRLDSKNSNLALNDAKLKYQELFNSYDWQDPSKPTSNEWMDFHEKARQETTESYNLMTDEDRGKYDLFYATKDGVTEKLIHGEAKTGALQLTENSLQNFQTEEDIEKWTESMDGLVTKKELYEIAGKKADSFVSTGALDNLTTEQINETFPYMNFIKDPAIGTKFKELIVKKKTEEGVSDLSSNGFGIDAISSKTKVPRKKALEIVTKNINNMVGSEDAEVVKRGIEMANHNGIRIKQYDNLPNKMSGSVDTNPSAAVSFLKQFNDTKDVYPYSQKVEESMNAYNIVASIHGLDITTEVGIQTAKHHIDKANDPNAPKLTMPKDQDILDELDPVGWNTASNYGQDEFNYLAPRIRELYKYTDGNLEAAIDIAKEEWDSFDTDIIGETPYGMFAKSDDEIKMVKEQYSNTTDADDVNLEYISGDVWAVTTIDDDGNEITKTRTSRQLKAAVRERQTFKDSLETLDAVVSKTKLGDSLREKQITADAKEVKTMIDTQVKSAEETIGHKLNSVQKEELSKKVVDVLKDEVRKADLKEKGGLAYNDETKTVTFEFGKVVKDIMSTMMGIKVEDEPPEYENNEQKPMEEKNMIEATSNKKIMESFPKVPETKDEIIKAQKIIGVEADGIWGKKSQIAFDMYYAEKPNGSRVFAGGRYQVIPSTLNEAIMAGYVSTRDNYGVETQERVMDYLIEKKRPQISKFINGSGKIDDALLALAQEWASMPSPVKTKNGNIGDSYYGGANKSGATLSKVKEILIKAKKSGSDKILRDFIAKHESGKDGYNAYNSGTQGNKILAGVTKYDFSKMSVASVLKAQG